MSPANYFAASQGSVHMPPLAAMLDNLERLIAGGNGNPTARTFLA
jgi:hypothetical protein